MITIKQIKAARALLEWTQEDLARSSGLSLPTLANIERGSTVPRQDTLQKIQTAFEDANIEFLEPMGVQLAAERLQVKVWSGRESAIKLWQDLMREFSDMRGGDVLFCGVNERQWSDKYPKELKPYIQKMVSFKANYRLLLCEGDNFIIGNPTQYRQISKELFAQNPYCIYRKKIALITWGPPQRIILIENQTIAETFRLQFESSWLNGKTVKNPTYE